MNKFHITGFPEGICETEIAVCRSRVLRALKELCDQAGIAGIELTVSTGAEASLQKRSGDAEEPGVEQRALQYAAEAPLWTMEQLVIPDQVREELLSAMEMVSLEPLVFDAWGLREIEPFPRSVLNFHGPPGTGKTLAAHAVAAEVGMDILVASYAQIESKYHGDGPKNVEALFFAALRDDAVLFIDEADSLLSRRLTNVTQGSEQAINSMRSQLLVCLERHKGLVIFATNLVENYDSAFETRVRNIRFPLPTTSARASLWSKHLPPRFPLDGDVKIDELAARSKGLCGRDIKNAVIDAAVRVARLGRHSVRQSDLVGAVERILRSRSEAGHGTPASA